MVSPIYWRMSKQFDWTTPWYFFFCLNLFLSLSRSSFPLLFFVYQVGVSGKYVYRNEKQGCNEKTRSKKTLFEKRLLAQGIRRPKAADSPLLYYSMVNYWIIFSINKILYKKSFFYIKKRGLPQGAPYFTQKSCPCLILYVGFYENWRMSKQFDWTTPWYFFFCLNLFLSLSLIFSSFVFRISGRSSRRVCVQEWKARTPKRLEAKRHSGIE